MYSCRNITNVLTPVVAICRQVTDEESAGQDSPTPPTQTRPPYSALACTVPPRASRPNQAGDICNYPQPNKISSSSSALLALTLAASPEYHQANHKPHIDTASFAMQVQIEQRLISAETATSQEHGKVEPSAEPSMQHQQSSQQEHKEAAVEVCKQQQHVVTGQYCHKVGAQPLQPNTAYEETNHRSLFAGRGICSEDEESCHMPDANEQCEDNVHSQVDPYG